jgi:hypothetical protein
MPLILLRPSLTFQNGLAFQLDDGVVMHALELYQHAAALGDAEALHAVRRLTSSGATAAPAHSSSTAAHREDAAAAPNSRTQRPSPPTDTAAVMQALLTRVDEKKDMRAAIELGQMISALPASPRDHTAVDVLLLAACTGGTAAWATLRALHKVCRAGGACLVLSCCSESFVRFGLRFAT